jgi:hypothetical protein
MLGQGFYVASLTIRAGYAATTEDWPRVKVPEILIVVQLRRDY